MVVSRMTMLALCVVSILWLPILQQSSDGLLFDYIQSITSYLGPPVVTVFVMGIFWERTNEPVSVFHFDPVDNKKLKHYPSPNLQTKACLFVNKMLCSKFILSGRFLGFDLRFGGRSLPYDQ